MDKVSALAWVLQAIFVPLFIRSGWPKTKRSSLFIKMVCSTVFVLFGLYVLQFGQNKTYGMQIFIGLICGWVGDIFLTMGPFFPEGNKRIENTITILGGLAFFAGHILYIVAFFSVSEKKTALFLILYFVTLAIEIVLKQILRLKMGGMTIPILVYAMMVTLMFTSGVVAGLSAGIPALCVGAGLFLLSDLTLGVKTFSPKFNTLPVRILYLTAYYVAQMLLVHSIALA